MKKTKKIIIIALCVILPLIACVIAAPFVINLNNYKGKIVNIAKSNLGRDMDFDNIEISLLSGLGAEIRGLRIAENPEFGKGDFVHLERLQIKIKLFPLLKKQVQVKELILEKPRIQLIKNQKGEFNFKDLAGSQPTSPAKPESKDEKAGEKEQKGGASPLAGLLVSTFTLNQGQIVFVDESSPQGTTSTTIDMLDLKFTDISLNNPINTFVACRLPGSTKQNLIIKGSLGPLGDALDMKRLFTNVTLSLHEFNLGDYKSYMPNGMPITPVNGAVALDVSLKGNMSTGMNVEGNIQCDELTLAGADGVNVLDKTSLTLREKINFSQEKGTLDIHQMDIKLNESDLSVSGRVEGLNTKPQWDVTFRAQGFDTNYASTFYPSIRDMLPKDTTFSGMMGMDMASKGTMDNLKATGTIEMKDVDLQYGKTFHKSRQTPCQISFNATKSGEDIQLNPFALTIHTLSLKTSGSVNGFSNPRFDLLIDANNSEIQGWDAMVPALKEYDAEGNFAFKTSIKGPLNDASINLQFSVPKIALKIAKPEEKNQETPAQKIVIEAMEMQVQAEKKDSDIKASGSLAV
ncbi:MAG: AsmA family protein, partial [Planctomycetota bacterium]